MIAEYVFLGASASVAGAVLGNAASWGLSYYCFGATVALSLAPTVAVVIVVPAVTVAAGWLGCWGMFRGSALEALRAEA